MELEIFSFSHRLCAPFSFNITIFRFSSSVISVILSSPSAIVPAYLRRRHLSGLSTLHLRYSDFSAAGNPRRTPKTPAEIDSETPYYHQTPLIVDVDDGEGLSLLSFTRMRSGFVFRDCSEVGRAALVKGRLGLFERKTGYRFAPVFSLLKYCNLHIACLHVSDILS
jgi:hypothetical protein